MSAPDLTDAAVLREDAAQIRFRVMYLDNQQCEYTGSHFPLSRDALDRAALALEAEATRLERPAPDLTAHDEAVEKARDDHANAVVVYSNARGADAINASVRCATSMDALIAAADARGYARAKLEAQP